MSTSHLTIKRIVKDIELIKNNESYLKTRGIYFYFDEHNIHDILLLVTPRHKQDSELTSPYTGGFFLFEIHLGDDYPLSPPKIKFNPKQTYCRLHPNYYQCGKVCLSVINTWGNADWSPSMSLMSLVLTLEERLYERALTCEPGYENAKVECIENFNRGVELAKYKVAIIDVLKEKYQIYKPFKAIIAEEWRSMQDWHKIRLSNLLNSPKETLSLPCYSMRIDIDYTTIVHQLDLLTTTQDLAGLHLL